MLHHVSLQAQRILVQGDEFLVLEQLQSSFVDGCHVTANK